jgi:hypothetical protein
MMCVLLYDVCVVVCCCVLLCVVVCYCVFCVLCVLCVCLVVYVNEMNRGRFVVGFVGAEIGLWSDSLARRLIFGGRDRFFTLIREYFLFDHSREK